MSRRSASVPDSLLGYLRSWGPGVIVVLTWLGAGDIVDCSIAGAGWSYSLMWALALALLVRFTFVTIMAKYQLCNPAGETIIAGYARLGRWAPVFIAVATVLFAHLTNSYMAKGAGEAWHNITHRGSPALWSALWCACCLAIAGRGLYSHVEKVMYVFLAAMTLLFLGGAIAVGPDLGAVVAGTLTPTLPSDMNMFAAIVIVVSLIGAVGGSLSNLMYPYMIMEKGWTGPEHRKVQLFDLLLSVLAVIVIDLAVWVVAAEVLYPRGIQVQSLADIAEGLKLVAGRAGEIVFYLGVFGAVFTSWIGVSLGYAHLFVDSLHKACPHRACRYQGMKNDPAYRLFILFAAVTPLIWTIPGTPSFVYLTVLVNALIVVVMPVLVIGLLVMTNKRQWIGAQYTNNWLENAVLLMLAILTFWASARLALSMLDWG